eukprot:9084778-Karenia_brevis.AAC.1
MQSQMQQMIQNEGWSLRFPWSNWVTWIPRERNLFADGLANLCLDMQQGFAVYGDVPSSSCNFVTVSDGASPASRQNSSASWAVLSVNGKQVSLVAAGAQLFQQRVSSQEAETTGLELAIAAMRNGRQ